MFGGIIVWEKGFKRSKPCKNKLLFLATVYQKAQNYEGARKNYQPYTSFGEKTY